MGRIKFNFGTLCLCLAVLLVSADDSCDKSKCPGPTMFYNDIKCQPVYKSPDDCCPYKYNCDHLKARSPDKCYVNGHEYDINEPLKDEHRYPCDIGCICRKMGYTAEFMCATVDCAYYSSPTPNCYLARNISECCPGAIICPEKPEDRPTCEVDGKIYKDGELFVPISEPNKQCACGPGYKGENIEPFCREESSTSRCRSELYHAYEIYNNCVPTFYFEQSPQKDCSVAYRCQNQFDRVIQKNRNVAPSQPDDDMVCEFGTLSMRYGDELNQATDYSSVCMRCVCEVGPYPTCQSLPYEECDQTKYLSFYSR